MAYQEGERAKKTENPSPRGPSAIKHFASAAINRLRGNELLELQKLVRKSLYFTSGTACPEMVIRYPERSTFRRVSLPTIATAHDGGLDPYHFMAKRASRHVIRSPAR